MLPRLVKTIVLVAQLPLAPPLLWLPILVPHACPTLPHPAANSLSWSRPVPAVAILALRWIRLTLTTLLVVAMAVAAILVATAVMAAVMAAALATTGNT